MSSPQNSVRHNLSLHKNIFRKIPNEKEGKSCFWTVISDEKVMMCARAGVRACACEEGGRCVRMCVRA